jgi:hypothetical protein
MKPLNGSVAGGEKVAVKSALKLKIGSGICQEHVQNGPLQTRNGPF